jgi:hypothetical protein
MALKRRFSELLRTLRVDAGSLLTSESVVACRHFFDGYQLCNTSVRGLVEGISPRFPGPAQADVFTRAFLSGESSVAALSQILVALEDSVTTMGEPVPASGPAAGLSITGAIMPALKQGRPGMLLGNDPTVDGLCDYISGHIQGVASIDLSAGKRLEDELASFDIHVRRTYQLQAPWNKIIRSLEGSCERGLRRVLELLDTRA